MKYEQTDGQKTLEQSEEGNMMMAGRCFNEQSVQAKSDWIQWEHRWKEV